MGSIPRLVAGAGRVILAFWVGRGRRRRGRLTLDGYEAVQESSYWALPVAPGLDLWGVDRQLGGLDFRQRSYFRARRQAIGEDAGIWFVAPDPAIAFGEPWDLGGRMLAGCELSLKRDRVLYQCGDMHQYERRAVGRSLHVIAGGGGAFLHGTRIVADPRPAAVAWPNAAVTRRLALEVPFKLMIGRAGYLVHMAAALLAAVELGLGYAQQTRLVWTSGIATVTIVWVLYTIAGHQRAHPRRVLALAVPFGLALGLLPLGLHVLLRQYAAAVPLLGRDTGVILVYSLVAALLFGTFLALCALGGLEMQQVFTVLGHPGFKHFVRMRVSKDGAIDAWVIGKDDPLVSDGPWLVDRVEVERAGRDQRNSTRGYTLRGVPFTVTFTADSAVASGATRTRVYEPSPTSSTGSFHVPAVASMVTAAPGPRRLPSGLAGVTVTTTVEMPSATETRALNVTSFGSRTVRTWFAGAEARWLVKPLGQSTSTVALVAPPRPKRASAGAPE